MNKAGRILVVDDDTDIGIMIKMILEYKGYEVVVTDRAENLDSLMSNEQFNLVIMDMLLSGINGIDVCKKLKENEATSSLPVIMISAHPNAREVCLEAGADDFIAKPFDMEDILSKINSLINKK